MSFIEGETDPLQFVYQPNENVEDAKLFIFNTEACVKASAVPS